MDTGRRFPMNVFYVVVLFYGRNLRELVKGRSIAQLKTFNRRTVVFWTSDYSDQCTFGLLVNLRTREPSDYSESSDYCNFRFLNLCTSGPRLTEYMHMLIKLKCYSNEFYTRNNKTNVLKTDIMAKDLIDMFFLKEYSRFGCVLKQQSSNTFLLRWKASLPHRSKIISLLY